MRPPKPDVTIFADASHDHRTGTAGWAAWVKADGAEAVTVGSVMKIKPDDATEAEVCALANALTVAHLQGLLGRGAVVMLQSDCLSALALILGTVAGARDRPAVGGLPVVRHRRMRITPTVRAALDVITKIAADRGLLVQVRHVKGHREGGGRQWVNRQVDVMARAKMRAARDAAAGG